MPVTVRINIGDEFERVANALREVDADLPGELREELRDAVDPLVRTAQRRVLRVQTHGPKHSGLRARVAKGVQARVHVGRNPGVEVVATMKERDERNLPGYMDDPAAGWRHPVFDNRHVWVRQHTGAQWFNRTFAEGDDDIEGRLDFVMNRAAERIALAGR